MCSTINKMKMMRRLVVLVLASACALFFPGCLRSGETGPISENTSSVTDMAGRQVNIPDEIRTVYATGPIGTIMLYTLAPDMLAG